MPKGVTKEIKDIMLTHQKIERKLTLDMKKSLKNSDKF